MINVRHFIRKVLSEIMIEDYPSSFDMELFKKLPSFTKRIEYAASHLKRISSGSGRVVFEIDDKKVLKIAKNIKGLEQNTTEAEYFIQNNYGDIVTKLYDSHIDDQWIEMEKATKVNTNTFKNITGIDFDNFAGFLRRIGTHNNSYLSDDIFEIIRNNPFANKVGDLMVIYDMPHGILPDSTHMV